MKKLQVWLNKVNTAAKKHWLAAILAGTTLFFIAALIGAMYYHNLVLNALSAIGSLMAGSGAILAVYYANKAYDQNRLQAINDQRAYVEISSIGMKYVPEADTYFINILIVNNGKTPAHNIEINGTIQIVTSKTEDTVFERIMARSPAISANRNPVSMTSYYPIDGSIFGDFNNQIVHYVCIDAHIIYEDIYLTRYKEFIIGNLFTNYDPQNRRPTLKIMPN